MRRRCDRTFGLGPLFFFEGEGAGASGGSAGSGDAGAGAGAGAGTGAPPAGNGGTGNGAGAPPAGGEDRSNWIPRDRFDAVNTEREQLRREKEEREKADLEAKGEHQKLAEQEKAKREAAEARAVSIARRASFIGAAAGKVADPEAAYKLALADGLLNDLDVDDDGNAKDPKRPGAIVDDVVKRYEFLKPKNGDRSYGGDRSGAGSGPEIGDPSKLSARELLSAGYSQASGRQRGS